jgi:hypothetical protein
LLVLRHVGQVNARGHQITDTFHIDPGTPFFFGSGRAFLLLLLFITISQK